MSFRYSASLKIETSVIKKFQMLKLQAFFFPFVQTIYVSMLNQDEPEKYT